LTVVTPFLIDSPSSRAPVGTFERTPSPRSAWVGPRSSADTAAVAASGVRATVRCAARSFREPRGRPDGWRKRYTETVMVRAVSFRAREEVTPVMGEDGTPRSRPAHTGSVTASARATRLRRLMGRRLAAPSDLGIRAETDRVYGFQACAPTPRGPYEVATDPAGQDANQTGYDIMKRRRGRVLGRRTKLSATEIPAEERTLPHTVSPGFCTPWPRPRVLVATTAA
jgi:hypothetical protein